MMKMDSLSQQQAQIVAQLTTQLRPGWDHAGIMAALQRNVGRADGFTVAIAMLAAAQEPTNKTPGVVNHEGKHWDRAAAHGAQVTAARPAEVNPYCPAHPDVPEWECGPCHRRAPRPSKFYAMVEQAAAEARAARVPSGVS